MRKLGSSIFYVLAHGGRDAIAEGGTRFVFAVPTETFYRSVALQCRSFVMTVGDGDRPCLWWNSEMWLCSLSTSLIDFRATEPSSQFHMKGMLNWSTNDVVFAISEFVGSWYERLDHDPSLQMLRIRRQGGKSQRHLCVGLSLGRRKDVKQQLPETKIALDTGHAYNWMRFTCYLDWARYMIRYAYRIVVSLGSVRPAPLFVDVGCGSGWLSILLRAHLQNQIDVLGTDISEMALTVARANIRANSMELHVEQGDMFTPLENRSDLPFFIFFYPAQNQGTKDGFYGSPKLSVIAPGNNELHFFERFCGEVRVHPDGVIWLGVNWELLPDVIRICCGQLYSITLPKDVRDTRSPSALVELRKSDSEFDEPTCIQQGLVSAESAAEYQIRAVGAQSDVDKLRLRLIGAKRGFARAQNYVGRMYFHGVGMERDLKKAVAWFLEAAARGHEDAMTNLGQMFAKGIGVDENETVAAEWYRKAAEHGQIGAQGRLGHLCLHSAGVQCEIGEARSWLLKASMFGDALARQLLRSIDGLDFVKDSNGA